METDRICPNCRKPLPPDVPMGLCPECLIKSGFPTGTEPGEGGMGRFVPPSVEEIARLFPQFEILGFIGKGGMGAVYKARQPALDRLVALKVLPPAVANDPGFAERFNREARALARLSHPNIVVVYDFGTAGALNYLVMEFVDGTNLREVERAGKLSAEQALAIVPQICEALQFAHNEGIVHRDIKPENLLIDKKGRVKIADFGIAKILDVPSGKVSLTGAKDVVGTPHYMAPEQIEKPQTVDHRADIYSLGVVFYEMLTGELPLGKFAPPSKKVQVDVRLDEVVLHTLEKEPERRYQQASQIKTDVETIAGTPPPVMGALPVAGTAPSSFPAPLTERVSDKIILPAFLLAFFFGIFGAHRFYVGKIWTGILQLFTFGGLGIWATIDWILILCKAFTDKQGRRITNWWHPSVGAAKPPAPPKSPVPPKTDSAPSSGSNAIIVAPAVALMAAGCLKLFFALMTLLFNQFGGRVGPLNSAFGHIGFPVWGFYTSFTTVVFSVIPALVIIYGAVEMMRIRSYGWAVAATIVAIAFCNIIGLPAGIWALIVLLQRGVRETFANQQTTVATETWPWILGAVAVFCLLFVLMISLFAFLFEATHVIPLASLANVHVTRAQPPPSQPLKSLQALDKAKAELHHVEAQYQKGLATAMDVQLAKDKVQLLEAQRMIVLQTPGYQDGHVTYEAYQQDLNDLTNAQAKLIADEATMQNTNAQAPAIINTTVPLVLNGTSSLNIINQTNTAGSNVTLAVAANGTTPLAYQWQFNGANQGTAIVSNSTDNTNIVLTKYPEPIEKVHYGPVVVSPDNSWSMSAGVSYEYDVGDATDYSKSFTVEPDGKLTINVDRGDVHITGSDESTVVIRVQREVSNASDSDAAEILKEEHVILEQDQNGVSITAQNPPSLTGFFGNKPNLNVHYEITVPRKFEPQVETTGGDVDIARLENDVHLKTMGGKLDCQDIGGDVDGYTVGGDIHATGCKGGLRLETMGGNINVEEFTGPAIHATTQGGSISTDFAAAPTADCELHTTGGNVTARMPETAAVTFDAQTDGGSISTDFPVQPESHFANDTLKGSINGGGPTLAMETLGGNIEVSKR